MSGAVENVKILNAICMKCPVMPLGVLLYQIKKHNGRRTIRDGISLFKMDDPGGTQYYPI